MKNITPVLEVKLNRHSSYSEEYGTMSHEQRMQIMKRDTFHIDSELIEGNIVLFLDDIRITGAHEHGIIKCSNHII